MYENVHSLTQGEAVHHREREGLQDWIWKGEDEEEYQLTQSYCQAYKHYGIDWINVPWRKSVLSPHNSCSGTHTLCHAVGRELPVLTNKKPGNYRLWSIRCCRQTKSHHNWPSHMLWFYNLKVTQCVSSLWVLSWKCSTHEVPQVLRVFPREESKGSLEPQAEGLPF